MKKRYSLRKEREYLKKFMFKKKYMRKREKIRIVCYLFFKGHRASTVTS